MIIRNDMNVSYVRIFHASPDAPAVDIYINGNLAFSNLSYKEFTQYNTLMPGEYNVQVYEANKKDKPVLTQTVQIPSKKVITVAAAGNLIDLQLVPYIEGNADDLPVGESRVRVTHLAPDAPNIDVLINGDIAFKDIGFLDETDYLQLESSIYDISIEVADTNDKVLVIKSEFKSQKVYTIYIIGEANNLSSIQSLDGSTFVRFL